jgi:hypothetical protein
LAEGFSHCNTEPPHQALKNATPAEWYFQPDTYGAKPVRGQSWGQFRNLPKAGGVSGARRVTQIFNLLYRRIAFGKAPPSASRSLSGTPGGLKIRDTAECNSAPPARPPSLTDYLSPQFGSANS